MNKTTPIKLSEISTAPSKQLDKDQHKHQRDALVDRFGELQHLMYAEGKHSLLIIIQGMDAAGKDGLLRDVFSKINPLGVKVKGFKKPTEEEFGHDFLWRVHPHAPEKGMITVFNRSHYEEVLIQRVHNWVDMERVHQRFEHINNFERLLAQENGTHILKFYLHVSHEEQHERLAERLEMPHKMWKYNPADMKESQHWDKYMEAYEDAINHCGPEIPWHIIPADKNWYKEYLVAKTIVDLLESLDMKFPALNKKD